MLAHRKSHIPAHCTALHCTAGQLPADWQALPGSMFSTAAHHSCARHSAGCCGAAPIVSGQRPAAQGCKWVMYCCHGCTGTMLLLLLSCERSCRWQNASSLNSMQTDYERRNCTCCYCCVQGRTGCSTCCSRCGPQVKPSHRLAVAVVPALPLCDTACLAPCLRRYLYGPCPQLERPPATLLPGSYMVPALVYVSVSVCEPCLRF